MTGPILFNNDISAHTRGRAEPYAPLGWLPKPYTMASLVAVVTEAVAALRRP